MKDMEVMLCLEGYEKHGDKLLVRLKLAPVLLSSYQQLINEPEENTTFGGLPITNKTEIEKILRFAFDRFSLDECELFLTCYEFREEDL